MDLVKRCPTCGADNAPTAARCACGAFLIGVDLTERAAGAGDPMDARARAPAMPARGTMPASANDTQTAKPRSGALEQAGPLEPQAAHVLDDRPRHAASTTPQAPTESAVALCRYDDCAQPNPPGTQICVYCNRPLGPAPQAAIPASPQPLPARSQQHLADRAPVRRSLIQLPATLAARFEIVEPLKAAGGEADLLVVVDKAMRERAVLKLYRHGFEPNTEVLERVSRAAPEQLVHLIEHGRDEGVPYELLEYCEHGSLRTLLKGRPIPLEAAKTLLTELADAIAHLHACGIVHRDLKPENVLIRGLLPLDLVLTDFGIASVAQATMHYTSAARTLRYSAPEAGSNWVGKATDYWALGMILVEALSGRHPFDKLSEAVIAHWLVTKPIDVSGVTDARWQQLCRGLLTRDPKARWGAAEIERWLQGDASLAVVEEQAPPLAGAPRAYRIGSRECRTARELAVALAGEWTAGVKDLKRGMLRAWLQNELRDQNLARAAADAEEALELSDDERLLRLLLRLDPQLPPVFKGYDVSLPGLAALTRKALEDHNEERQAVIELVDRRLLALFPGDPLQEILGRFEQAKHEFEQALARAFAAGAPRSLAPQGREWQLRMLLFVLEPPQDSVERLRASVRRVGSRAAQRCDWYRALGDADQASAAMLAAMVLLGPPAAQQGMETAREEARAAFARLSMTIESNPTLQERHGAAHERLAALIEASPDEEQVLALAERIAELAHAVDGSIEALAQEVVFVARPIAAPARLAELRRRIGEWAAWRAGEGWARFGEQIELRAAIERRGYRVELASQIEARRIPYRYSATDIARMPEEAQRMLGDVWRCAMRALPAFAADVKVVAGTDLLCPRCGVSGKAELQEAWGSTAYPFSSTFACHDKIGVQCQTRLARSSDRFPAAEVPAFVADFVEQHGQLPDAPERTFALTAAAIPSRWIDAFPAGSVREGLASALQAAAEEPKAGERTTAQRLAITWTRLVEVRYRFGERDYTVWIPERVDALPIALQHPLPSPADTADRAREPLPVQNEEVAAQPSEAVATGAASPTVLSRRSGSAWWRSLAAAAIVAAVLYGLLWIVNWKP